VLGFLFVEQRRTDMVIKKPNAASIKAARDLGRWGAYRRALALSPERRSEIARQAVLARWAKAARKAADTLKDVANG
jgi:hypothetical protein